MMGNPGLLHEMPDIPALLSEGGRDCQQAAAADRTLTGLDAMSTDIENCTTALHH
jgi:hypothetical protein